MRCRKNYRDLLPVERTRFIQALYHVKANGVIDQFANAHVANFGAAHGSSHFLPWHREFLRRFENALRSYHPDIAIPYWNSTVDTSPSDPLWDHDFLGQFDSAWGLNRSLGSATLPPPDNVQTALELDEYADLWPYVQGTALHNPPHNWVSGVMSSAESPLDPVFYLHHCWIDVIWAQWQLLHPEATFDSSGSGRGLNDPMAPWPTTPSDIIDHRAIHIYHFPPGMQQDMPEVTLETPSVNFIDVPEGETRLQAAVFNLDACESVQLTVIDDPVVTSGPPGTEFNVHASPVVADPAVDTKARVWFSFTGVGPDESATGTVSIRCEETDEIFDIDFTANTIERPTAAIVMVLDQSNSMNFDSGIAPGISRSDVLKFSTSPVSVVLDDDHAVAVCGFDHDAHPIIGMTPVAGAGKITINGAISTYAPNPDGWTSIGEGVALAHDILEPVIDYDVKAMVVLTDGRENHGPHDRRDIGDVEDMISGLNGHVFAIGLGRPEVLNPGALENLCSGNDGYMQITGDLTPDASFRLAKYYQQIFAGITNNQIVLDPDGLILPGQVHRVPFWLNEADITAKSILLTPAPHAIRFVLEAPDGEILDPGVAAGSPMAAFELGEQVSLYRTGLPIPLGDSESGAGKWHAVMTVDEKYYRRYLATLENFPKMQVEAATHGIRYSLNIHAYSNLRMIASLSQSSHEPGATITIRAILTEYGIAVDNRAQCRVELTRPDDTQITLSMAEVEAGVFEVTSIAAMPGIYRFRILAEGQTLRGRTFTREQLRTGSVWRGGDNPPPPAKDPDRPGNRICRLIECLLKQRGVRESMKKAGISPDDLRRCFERYCREPAAGQSPAAANKLVERLRAFIPDERVLKAVMREIRKS